MEKIKSLPPWEWFKKTDNSAPSHNKEDIILWENTYKNANRVFDDFIRDIGNFDNFIPNLFKNNFKANLKILPRIDISDNDKEYIIEADLPGVKETDLDVSISKNGILSIKGKRETKEQEKHRNYYRIERSFGSFERNLSLPQDCNLDKLSATFNNGILTVKTPKKELDTEEVKKIEIDNLSHS